jgi:hypothetical protein
MGKEIRITVKLRDGHTPIPDRFTAIGQAYVAANRIQIDGPDIYFIPGGIVGDGFAASWDLVDTNQERI